MIINQAIDVNALAQEIRRVDGNHSLGAGALAEALIPFLSTLPIAVEGKAEPRAWFVKDFADGWIHFDNEVDAMRQIEATGAIWYVAYPPFSSPGKDGGQEVEAVSVEGSPLLEWAVDQWKRQVGGRPLRNVHRRSLDDVWRQVIRWAGGDPDKLVGPPHDELLAMESKR